MRICFKLPKHLHKSGLDEFVQLLKLLLASINNPLNFIKFVDDFFLYLFIRQINLIRSDTCC